MPAITKATTVTSKPEFKGLSDEEVLQQRSLNGANTNEKSKNLLLENILSFVKEPMFLLLLVACGIYFILQEYTEAITMFLALLFVASIDIYQNFRSQKAVKALNRISQKKAKVIRNGMTIEIAPEELVTNDIIICEEGMIVSADAVIEASNDFSLNESILTGESVAVEKFKGDEINQGTLIVRGYCYAKISAVGQNTALSGIGKLVASTGKEQTPLQIKVTKFVKVMVIAGGVAFAFVWIYYWWESKSLLVGLLHGLAMAMSVLPEEIPVAFSAFMALGAYRLFKKGIIAKTPKTVETLGSATVICVDKTGTLTQNLMQVATVYDIQLNEEISFLKQGKATPVLEYAMWASEESPFDPMELSIHEMYGRYFKEDLRPHFHMVKEFPLSGKPPVMTHLYQNENKDLIISCKGALEGVLKLCSLEENEKQRILEKGAAYAQKGLRVLGVAKGDWNRETLPETQEETSFIFLGIITFYDPPAENIQKVISDFYDSNVSVKMITGDFAATAQAIASQVGIKSYKVLTGYEINKLEGTALLEAVKNTSVFARVAPETKLKIIEALKDGGEVVSMTGDGVNDAPALKAAHIGIAMGKRGSDVAKAAAGLVLSGDDLSKMVDAIFLGRRIHINLSKAIRYIISIHVPIILLVIFPIFFGWLPSMLLTPIHVIFLELIMGPTCSIIYENEPVPNEEMKTPTKTGDANLLESSQLTISILQGVVIALGCLGMGYSIFATGADEQTVRSYMFSTLLISNIFLTLFNRSFTATVWKTMKWKNIWIPIILSISILIMIIIHNVPAAQTLFEVKPLSISELLLPLLVAFVSTFWMEVVIYLKQVKTKQKQEIQVNS